MAVAVWKAMLALGGLFHPLEPGDRFESVLFLFIWGLVIGLLWTRARGFAGLFWEGLNAQMDLSVSSMGRAMELRVAQETSEEVHVTHYGAVDVHPRHLVYWVCVRSDSEKARLESDQDLNRDLRQILDSYAYPRRARKAVMIGFESQEAVDRVSQGDWWRHFK